MLGAAPIVACTHCHDTQDYQAYRIYQVWRMYVAQALALSIATMTPHGTLPRLVEHAAQQTYSGLVAHRTRAHWRTRAWLMLIALFAIDVGAILYAEQLPLPPGHWEHWHAYAHIVRHVLLLCLIALVWRGVRWQPPFLQVLEALQAVADTHTRFEARASNPGSLPPPKPPRCRS